MWLAQASLVSRRTRRSPARVGVALVYHRIGGEGGDAKREILPAVPTRVFTRLLRHFHRHYRVVPASGLLEAVHERARGERFPVAITFDDDLASHVTEALPALQRAGVTATFFLSGTPRPFWWQDLQRAVDGRLVDSLPHVAEDDLRAALAREEKAIFRVAAAIEALPRAQRDETAAALGAAAGAPPNEGLDAEGIRTLVGAGLEVGFHTLRHEALPALEDGDLAAALREGRDELATLTGTRVDAISYPHGKADERVATAARSAGYAYGFTTERSTVTPSSDPLLLPRIPPALSTGKTALRVARAVASSAAR
jgi:peptidoglycan/xylan/chitin deacetylase (PgdA/CDA1 family)